MAEDNETDIEDEMEQYEKEAKQAKAKNPKQPTHPLASDENNKPTITERYIVVHQPEKRFIYDSVKEEVVAEGFNDNGVAMSMAKIFNDQDKLLVQAGV